MLRSLNKVGFAFFFSLTIVSTACAAPAKHAEATVGQTFAGNASWYGEKFNGRKTASGEIFNMRKCSAAHRRLHLVTKVLVENPKNGKSTVVRVNDRGPYAKGRVMDLSKEAARKTGILEHGVGYIECTVIGPG